MNKFHMILAAVFTCCSLTAIHAEVSIEEKSAAQTEKYTNTEKGYSIDYPSDWKKNDVPQLDLVLFAPSKDDNTKPIASMNVISEKVGGGVTLDMFYTQSTANLTSALKDVQIEKTGTVQFNGTPGKWVQYTHVMQGVKFNVLQYFIVSNDTIYLLTFSTTTDDFSKYRPEFEKIANSFKLFAPAATQPAPAPVPAPATK